MYQVLIKSAERDGVIAISNLAWDMSGNLCDYEVTYQSASLKCVTKVCGYMSEGFALLLSELNSCMERDGGWSDEKSWASLEGEFELSATADSLGHTTLQVSLASGHYELDWRLRVGLVLDAHQLTEIARSANKFIENSDA